jgi:hypothetical protein
MLAGRLTKMPTTAAPALNAMTAKRNNAFMPFSLLPGADLGRGRWRRAKILLSARTATM